ncbi:hypothetical protein LJR225_003084 [Phenylobacterium sp. LjRoot225]|uniref:hypothetical protein n=1 Tax=Phenylobacterium sp. LjRoot225 TaxID=3342285 RepID=UPI003ECFA5F5
MAEQIAPNILDYLKDGVDEALSQIANSWRPDDPDYRADMYRQIMMMLSYGYFAYFHADAEHPDWSPLWNPVYTLQPNPDDIYYYAPIRGDLTYRVSGDRGTVKMVTFNTQRGISGMIDDVSEVGGYNDLDDRDLQVGPNGELEIIFSTERPAGYTGNWSKLAPEANVMMVRFRSYDWAGERNPDLSIECLDKVPLKARLTSDEILERIRQIAKMPGRATKLFFAMQNGVKERVGINVFEPVRYQGALSKQVYWPAVFELEDGEALIIETELPDVRPYWNIQLNDPYFNAVEYVYRLSSTNGAMAKISSDGKLRAVIALEDPGVPNWLDPAGFKQGTIYGRWYDCDSNPTPIIKRVPLAELRKHLPADTPTVTPEERDAELRARIRAAQRRRRW